MKTETPQDITHLKKLADKTFERYIKYRDSTKFINSIADREERWCQCLICTEWIPFSQATVKHFVKKSNLSLRWDEFNVNAVCEDCASIDNQQAHFKAISDKYGDDIAKELKQLSTRPMKLTVDVLNKIIRDSEQDLKEYRN